MREEPPVQTQARLLKANDIRGLGSKVVFNFEDLRQHGDAYLESVRQQARKLLEDAQAEVDSVRQQAQVRGLEQGEREGLKKAAETIEARAREIAEATVGKNLATTLSAIKGAADAMAIERDRWLQEWETTAIGLAAAVAGKILKRKLELHPEAAGEMIRGALQLAVGAPQIKLRLHPEDRTHLGGHAEAVVQAIASCGTAQIISDETLSRGGCVVETAHGVIDARIETLLDRIACELLDNP